MDTWTIYAKEKLQPNEAFQWIGQSIVKTWEKYNYALTGHMLIQKYKIPAVLWQNIVKFHSNKFSRERDLWLNSLDPNMFLSSFVMNELSSIMNEKPFRYRTLTFHTHGDCRLDDSQSTISIVINKERFVIEGTFYFLRYRSCEINSLTLPYTHWDQKGVVTSCILFCGQEQMKGVCKIVDQTVYFYNSLRPIKLFTIPNNQSAKLTFSLKYERYPSGSDDEDS